MIEEPRDPELEPVRADWEPPPHSPGFPARMERAFAKEFACAPWWRRRWPVVVAVAAAGLIVAVLVTWPFGGSGLQPVQQPHFIIVSEGEHP